jgi:chaperonin GroEL
MIPSRSGSALRRAAPKAARSVLARGAHKEVKFSNDGRAAMLAGVETLAKAVSVTLGPKGQFLIRAHLVGTPR